MSIWRRLITQCVHNSMNIFEYRNALHVASDAKTINAKEILFLAERVTQLPRKAAMRKSKHKLRADLLKCKFYKPHLYAK